MTEISLRDLASNVARAPDRSGSRAPAVLGDIGMRIARDGTWFYQGSPISRKPMVKLFSTVLHREADGAYYLITPAEKARVQVDDAPFVAVAVDVAGAGRDQILSFRTNVDDIVVADAKHPIRVAFDSERGEPAPYVTVRDGLEALINRPVYYELVELGCEADGEANGERDYGVWSAGLFFPLGKLEPLGNSEIGK
ncbi:MAG: DUF1285 domain-containing protein [Alphaproteobacteria bacterium]